MRRLYWWKTFTFIYLAGLAVATATFSPAVAIDLDPRHASPITPAQLPVQPPVHPPGTHDCNGHPVPNGVPCPPVPNVNPPITPPGLSLCHGIQLKTGIPCPPDPKQVATALADPGDLMRALADCVTKASNCTTDVLGSITGKVASQISDRYATQINDRVAFWQTQTRYCISSNIAPFPGKSNPDKPLLCDANDMGLFNGLLCSAGDANGCEAVRKSQGPDGQWWRAPSLIGKDRTHGGPLASMSEEQTWSVFLYLIEKNDKNAFDKWVKWIGEKSRPCWVAGGGGSCLFAGLPQWCTDTTETAACNFLPYECVAFEHLARHFNENPIEVSRKLGCDLVMAVTYGGSAGVLGLSAGILGGGLPAVMGALPVALTTNVALKGKLQTLMSDPSKWGASSPAFALGRKVTENVVAQAKKLPLPPAPPNLCLKDLPTFGLPLPKLPNLPGLPRADSCIISPTLFPAGLNLPALPTLGPIAGGFTTGYPVQEQVAVQAKITKVPYAIHKVAVQIYLLQRLGLDSPILQAAAGELARNAKPNTFFAYLSEHGSNRVAQSLLDRCPAPNGRQSPTRIEWIWEQPDDKADFAYWDCIFIAKLLANAKAGPTPVMLAMQQAQSSVVAKPFTAACNAALSTAVSANAVTAPADKNDFQITFAGPLSPPDVWYQGKTFIAPCAANYTVTVHIPAGSSRVDLVSTVRYGQPLLSLVGKSKEATQANIFLEQYEALGLVLYQDSKARSVGSVKMKIDMAATNPTAKK
ncbi:hypothetical protein ABIF35_006573 [Bradyrhizobium japonicum]|uniref:hypothetical protein n=1 Tax=Bradyrhizobium diazoefficiens TaxID=1355477 RepID=UPI003494ECE9